MTKELKSFVNIINMGRSSYPHALAVQKSIANSHLSNAATNDNKLSSYSNTNKNTLIIVEHYPVYTVGIRRQGYLTEIENRRLRNLGADFHYCDRGGLITFHGPGQLVAYPVLNLHHFTPSVRWYINALERTLIRTCSEFGVKGQITNDVGVWVKGRKIAAIGIHASRFITTHGVSLNCNVDLSWYDHIVACGLEGKKSTSLSRELDRDIEVSDVIEPFIASFCYEFNCFSDSSQEQLFVREDVKL